VNIDSKIIDLARGITYKRANLTRWEKVKIYFGLMQEPLRVKIEPILLCSLIPRVSNMILSDGLPKPKSLYEIGSVA